MVRAKFTKDSKMTFELWWEKVAHTSTPETYHGWEASCREAYEAGAKAEREACAGICAAKANSLESKVMECAGDMNEITNLRSAAWLISVCSSEIIGRSNA
jgi:hypothetical protein